MSLELYFLRSSEQKIVSDMLYHAQGLKENAIYSDFFGLSNKDLGLYAMQDNVLAGAIWSRKLNAAHKSNGFVDEDTPVVNLAVKPEFRNQGIATAMIEQFLLEAGSLYESLSISVLDDLKSIKFLEKFGFEVVLDSQHTSYADKKPSIIMKKALQKKEIVRPTDGYDAQKWMD
ncbi:GNAT family N-acetyltransferase [Sulfurimonas sp.]|uniref:GNAT family N-acetyltransferase n=1 Tax=Sulfurimonas sp. TaxID=2022749 RepID=UPI00260D653F|nr:GNAT family N-acetyltransferase [Sulfurimonas sp.]